MKKVLIGIGVLILILVAAAGGFYGLYVAPFLHAMMQTQTTQYDKQLTLITGGGGNTGILVSDSAVLVIDTKMDEPAKSLSETVHKLASNKPIIVINTHVHSDHTKGNPNYKGSTIIAGGNYDKAAFAKEAGDDGLATVWLKDSLVLHIGDETVTVLNLPFNAHTQSDIVVYLHNRKMLFGGDVILNQSAPAMFGMYGADANGYLQAFDLVESRFDITAVVPGHGPVGGKEVIDNYRIFFNDMKTAAAQPDKEKELVEKYKDYRQVPFLMSPEATVSYIRKSTAK